MNLGGRPCTCCQHPDRAVLDAEILDGYLSAPGIAAKFGISADSVIRHRQRHLPQRIASAPRARESDLVDADHLLGRVNDLYERTLAVLSRAEAVKDDRLLLLAVRELRPLLELMGKITGEMASQPTIAIQQVFNSFTAGLTPEQQARFIEQLTPESRALLGTLGISRPIDSTVIECDT